VLAGSLANLGIVLSVLRCKQQRKEIGVLVAMFGRALHLLVEKLGKERLQHLGSLELLDDDRGLEWEIAMQQRRGQGTEIDPFKQRFESFRERHVA
jgi:hypothetical protein